MNQTLHAHEEWPQPNRRLARPKNRCTEKYKNLKFNSFSKPDLISELVVPKNLKSYNERHMRNSGNMFVKINKIIFINFNQFVPMCNKMT